MSRFVFVTQQVDPEHPALGATVPMIRAIAERVDEVAVLCERAVPGALPGNCVIRTFGSRSRLGRGARFEAVLARELVPRPVAVLAHMVPLFAVLAAPLARPLRVPLLLWFTHWRASPLLRLAERVSTRVVSVDVRSFPLPSRKLVATGHAVDLAALPCAPHEPGLRLLALGRYSPAKGLETIVRAVAEVPGAELDVHGPALTPEEESHRQALQRLVEELGTDGRVRLGPPVPRGEVPALLARFDALVNNMLPGAPDKVVYEAAAACLPVLASNPVFDTLLPPELRFERDDPAGLAERIRALPAVTAEIRLELRRRVEQDHSVERWAARVLAAAER